MRTALPACGLQGKGVGGGIYACFEAKGMRARRDSIRKTSKAGAMRKRLWRYRLSRNPREVRRAAAL